MSFCSAACRYITIKANDPKPKNLNLELNHVTGVRGDGWVQGLEFNQGLSPELYNTTPKAEKSNLYKKHPKTHEACSCWQKSCFLAERTNALEERLPTLILNTAPTRKLYCDRKTLDFQV